MYKAIELYKVKTPFQNAYSAQEFTFPLSYYLNPWRSCIKVMTTRSFTRG